jgi:hypothetical protein
MNPDMDRDRGSDHDYDRARGTYEHSGYDRDQHREYDRDRTRSDDQTRDHGNSGQSDQNRDRDRSGTENGYEKTKYEQQPGVHGHAKTPPVTSHSSSKPKSNPDQDNGPSD